VHFLEIQVGENKKSAILESAIQVFSEKSFTEATISEIADGAGMVPSGIYTYFKNKEGIFFAIIENFLNENCSRLTKHLEGIQGAENKLRKAVWYHCSEYAGNKQTIKIILEARSYPRFYTSSAYAPLKVYAGIINRIIKEGMEQGVFCGISSPAILRDMILGTVDHIAIDQCFKDGTDALGRDQTIYEMAVRAATTPVRKDECENKKDRKKKQILNAATEIFARKGYDASMMEIAKSAGVGEGTVYEYYGTKENLLINIPGEKLSGLYTRIRGDAFEKRVKNIIVEIFKFYNDEKQYTRILVLMLRTNRQFYKSRTSRILDDLFNEIKDLIVRGQASGLFRNDLDLGVCMDFLFGTIDHIIIPWIIFNREYDLMQIGREVGNMFLNAIKDEQSSENSRSNEPC